jgi:hypothetical protein
MSLKVIIYYVQIQLLPNRAFDRKTFITLSFVGYVIIIPTSPKQKLFLIITYSPPLQEEI